MASVPLAEEHSRAGGTDCLGLRHAVGVVAGIGAHIAVGAEVDDQHVDGAVGLGLQDELAVELQRRAEEDGEHHRLAEELRHRRRIVVAGKDRIERRAHLDGAAAHVEGIDRERPHGVVAGGRPTRQRLHER